MWDSLTNVTKLLSLYLYNNSLEGSIPSSLGNCSYLLDVRLCPNKLNGTIHLELISIPSLSKVLNVSHNSLMGPLPAVVGNLNLLQALDVLYNKFSKESTTQLGGCLALETLYMQRNSFEGTIPNLSKLKGI
jgi:LRR receptor-like serine/threonine-protein kinase EFR